MGAPTTEYHFQTVDIVTKIKHKLSYKHPHLLFKNTSAVHNIWSCVKSTQFLTQEFQNSPHFFQSRTNFPNSKKKSLLLCIQCKIHHQHENNDRMYREYGSIEGDMVMLHTPVDKGMPFSIKPTLNSLKPTFFAHMDS